MHKDIQKQIDKYIEIRDTTLEALSFDEYITLDSSNLPIESFEEDLPIVALADRNLDGTRRFFKLGE